jgi:hypothetical protein
MTTTCVETLRYSIRTERWHVGPDHCAPLHIERMTDFALCDVAEEVERLRARAVSHRVAFEALDQRSATTAHANAELRAEVGRLLAWRAHVQKAWADHDAAADDQGTGWALYHELRDAILAEVPA